VRKAKKVSQQPVSQDVAEAAAHTVPEVFDDSLFARRECRHHRRFFESQSRTRQQKAQQKGEFMYFVSWIVVGLVAGWFGGKILKGNTYGPIMDIGMGICGAIAGGLLMQSAGFSGYKGIILTTFVAMIGAVVLTLLAGFVNGRRMFARQL
jgi:uncharacterized membrane protein YeaQ/YmgE (transglycosylase-associated protein family)